MKKFLVIFCFAHCHFSFLSAQRHLGHIDSTALPTLSPAHYNPEYLTDVSIMPDKWDNVKPGLSAGFGTTDELYFHREIPYKGISNEWTTTGWKGERLNAQLVLWAADTVEQVRVTVSNLKNVAGDVIENSHIELNMVRYIVANFPYGSELPDCTPSPFKNGFLMPDRFEQFERFDIPAKTVRPVWISVNVPQSAKAGIYTGVVQIKSTKGNKEMGVSVYVQKQQLPAPDRWTYQLDLWQNPWVVSNYYKVKPWSEEHLLLLKKHMKPYADAGGKFITTYGVHSPWGDNEYAIEGGMIEWIKAKDGKWRFDYSIFDKYVAAMMDIGIDKAITVYTPLPWGDRFFYTDETTGQRKLERWLPTSEVHKGNINIFLDDLRKHLFDKGWLQRTYIGINENAIEQTLAAIKTVKDNWKGWKITYAGNWHKELSGLLDDYSLLYGKEATTEEVKTRKFKGQTTTYYVCCNPAKPNNFLSSPPVEGRWQGWYAAAYGYDGFLRWAYDAWPEDPMRDGRYSVWAAGDSYLVYPGGNSCIRLEKLREGIVDYEKIRILKNLGASSVNPAVRKMLVELEGLLASISVNKDLSMEILEEDIKNGNSIIRKLSDLL